MIADLNELFTWLIGGGGAFFVVAWAASWYLEGLPWWQNLPSKSRSGIILIASLLLGLAATYVASLPPELLKAVEPYIKTILIIVGVWLTTQTAHKVNPSRRIKPPVEDWAIPEADVTRPQPPA